jgi:putative NADH-flavin reductase
MKQTITIALIGGTGKSGQFLVKELLNEGFRLRLLLRSPKKFQITHSSIEIIEGDARRYESIRALVDSSQVVMSTLGQPKDEPPIFSQATANVIRAMTECRIMKYILTTGLNVDSPGDKKSLSTQSATDWMKKNYPLTTADKQIEFDLLSRSELNWTLVRLPLIELTEFRKKIIISLEDCPSDKIGASDLAHFLIEQLSGDQFIRKAPFIGNVSGETIE